MPSDPGAEKAAALLADAASRGQRTLSEPQSKGLLQSLGIPVPRGSVVGDAREAAAAAEAIGLPVAVKAVAFNLTHKTEAGGVVCPVHTPAAVAAACEQIARSVRKHRADVVLEGFLIEEFRPASPEWILGMRVDPLFGPAIMFGLGGIYVDVLRQISFRLAPLREQDVEALLTEKPATRILEGVRGRPPVDREPLKALIGRLSDFATQPDVVSLVSEIEINPLAINEHGVLALDALVVLRAQEVHP